MQRNTRQHGFTLIELLVVVAIIALLIGILLPSLSRAREIANRAVCGTHLDDIYTGLYSYSINNRESFPKYGNSGAIGAFNTTNRRQDPSTVDPFSNANGGYNSNLSAALWVLNRNAVNEAGQFVCPSDRDGSEDDLKDGSNTAQLSETWDFKNAQALSYSMMNMYNDVFAGQWSSKAPGDWVFMSDDNNANTGSVHTHTQDESGLDTETIQEEENSTNHSNGEGQNFLFGDGHVEFSNDPFVGRAGDNAFAINSEDNSGSGTYKETATPPQVNKGEGQRSNRDTDSCMMPVSGPTSPGNGSLENKEIGG